MRNFRSERSTEAPMDFQWTNRANIQPVWATPASNDPNTPRKRSHDESNTSTPATGASSAPVFGSNQNVPFIFQPVQLPQTPDAHPWTPPPQFSPTKAFPSSTVEDVKDVDMTDPSPGKTDEASKEGGRIMALGGLRRIFNQRQRARSRPKRRIEGDAEEDPDIDDDVDVNAMTHNTSNHYTVNLPAPTLPQPDTPYVLLGYLQFFFNLSLILLFLYLVVQFILTVQRDVEHRISEYSMEIVQEIAMCALQYRNNLCSTNPIPAMAQQCSNWETCMNRDPAVVGRAKVGAELIAEVVNGFVEPISWKTLIFVLSSLSFLTVFINTLLSLYRARHQPAPSTSQSQHQAYSIPPALPYPTHPYNNYLAPGPDATWSRSRQTTSDDKQSPIRRRRLENGASVKVK
ncbi:hypothetical protein AX17_000841 [Amanita inopinata Kibby_2008]|nr:hypothetical protein AX17_000841 [Amanita inopinata Kibby_2008]